MLAGSGGQRTLFISGTASIVGHETVHVGDAAKQLEETLANIDALSEQAARHGMPQSGPARQLFLKAYLRHAEHFPAVQARLRQAFGPQARIVCLRADICRADLLLEIEGVALASGRWRNPAMRAALAQPFHRSRSEAAARILRKTALALGAALLPFLPAADATADEFPLWELGAGLGVIDFPDYRGSNERKTWLLPVPYFIYCAATFSRPISSGCADSSFTATGSRLDASVNRFGAGEER
ncbi:MAG: hypothetical protein MZW92_37815 [Comamonadaceae bacterium]|nr:hypothetical protein [Comamonadaceae bacterium]